MTIEILGLERKPSVDLFRKVFRMKGGSPDPSGSEFEELIGKLEGHPLATVLAATLAARYPSCGDALGHWAKASQNAKNSRHDSLETALHLSWEAVADAPLAHELWGVMALTPGDLPRAELDELADLSGTDPRDWVDAYARLRDGSLMTAPGDGSLSMLRPVREAFFSLASDDIVDRCLDLLTRRLVGIFEADGDGSGVMGTGPVHDLALESLPRALFLLGRSLALRDLRVGAPELARTLGNYYQFDWGASRPVLDTLLCAVRDEGDNKLAALAAYKAAQCAVYQNRLDEAGCLLEEAERLHRKAGDGLGEANDLGARAELAMRQGRLDEAGPLLEEAERLHRKAGSTLGEANDLRARAELLALQGDYDLALSELTRAEELYEGMGDEYSLGLAHELRELIELAITEE